MSDCQFISRSLGVVGVSVVSIMTLAIVASSMGCVHSAYVTRTLQFKKKTAFIGVLTDRIECWCSDSLHF